MNNSNTFLMSTQDNCLFTESDFSWTKKAFIAGGCAAIGYAYRKKNKQTARNNVKFFCECLQVFINTHHWNLCNTDFFVENDEWVRMPLYYVQDSLNDDISYFRFNKLLDWCVEKGLLAVCRMGTHGVNYIQIKFLALREFILEQLNCFALKDKNGNIILPHNRRRRTYTQRTNEKHSYTKINLPDDFTDDEIMLFEEFLKMRAETHHLNNSPKKQQELLDRLQELKQQNCDRLEVIRRAIRGKWTKFYHLTQEEPRQYPKKWEKQKRTTTTDSWHLIGSILKNE